MDDSYEDSDGLYGPEIHRRGLMLVLSSPSGAGKTTISRKLLERDENVVISISATTRQRRPGEVAGEHYHFVKVEDFNMMVNKGELLEYAKVFDNYYGTPRAPVEKALNSGRDVLFDIDWQGTQQLVEKVREDLVSIFILPPSMAELERRLKTRAQDSDKIIAGRMSKAGDELSHWSEYDYIIINTSIDESVDKVEQILEAERMKRRRQIGLADFVKSLRSGY